MQRESTNIPTTLQGKVVAITGVMRTVSRDDLKAALIAAGAIVTGSVNKHTTLLVAGSVGAGSKLEKAKEMGIPIIGEEILQMLRDGKFLTGEDRFPAFHVNQVEATEQALANVMAEAWSAGYQAGDCDAPANLNPYTGKNKVQPVAWADGWADAQFAKYVGRDQFTQGEKVRLLLQIMFVVFVFIFSICVLFMKII